ncbi:replication initiation protein [Paraburkholderia sp.]|uniref:replication initiation protein n=1 Tax=Paraburkholderia sp. TaxID=1926495 RepID=UPI00239DC40F|nr:replication initiation protein [Paraburkholderia sp.]MDE1180758.1 replication initiation protein [Paraburkholderia sp.]
MPISRVPEIRSENVKKHVAAIHTSGELSLLERKLSNVLLLQSYDSLLTTRTHQLPVRTLMFVLGWTESENVEKLREALRRLATTAVEFNVMDDGRERWSVMPILSFAEIRAGVCSYRYDEALAEKLFDPSIYATVNLGVQRKFSKSHALTLYENCLRFQKVGSTGWIELMVLRKLLGATQDYYDDFRRLNSKVIQKAVKEINEVSDIEVTIEYQKLGRSVVAVKFLIRQGPQQSLLTPDSEDNFAHIRESEIFQKLRAHGIGDKLALSFVIEDEERARMVVQLAEEKDKKGQIKRSTAGFIRTLIENKAEVEPAYVKNKREKAAQQENLVQAAAREARMQELRADYERSVCSAAVKALSHDDKRTLAHEFVATDGAKYAKELRPDSPTLFSGSVGRVTFASWLRNRVRPEMTDDGFSIWLTERQVATSNENKKK